jgi:hypothetical protein
MRRLSRSPGDGLDAAVQRGADDLGAQGIPLVVGAAEVEERAHVRGELAQLPLALVRDHLAEAHEVHLLLDLGLVDEAERLPVGRLELALGVDARRELLGDLLAQRFAERVLVGAEVAAQLLLGEHELVALGDLDRGLRLRVQHLGDPRRRRGDRRAHHLDGCVERGLGARFDQIHLGGKPEGERTKFRLVWAKGRARPRHCFTLRRASAPGEPHAQRRSESRISRSRTTSSGVAAGGGGSVRRSRLICRTITKMMKARIRKLITTVMKLP